MPFFFSLESASGPTFSSFLLPRIQFQFCLHSRRIVSTHTHNEINCETKQPDDRCIAGARRWMSLFIVFMYWVATTSTRLFEQIGRRKMAHAIRHKHFLILDFCALARNFSIIFAFSLLSRTLARNSVLFSSRGRRRANGVTRWRSLSLVLCMCVRVRVCGNDTICFFAFGQSSHVHAWKFSVVYSVQVLWMAHNEKQGKGVCDSTILVFGFDMRCVFIVVRVKRGVGCEESVCVCKFHSVCIIVTHTHNRSIHSATATAAGLSYVCIDCANGEWQGKAERHLISSQISTRATIILFMDRNCGLLFNASRV